MRALFKQFILDENGGPAIEAAVVCLFIATAMPAMIDISTLINGQMKLAGGIRAGEQYALKYPTDTTGITTAVTSGSNLSASDVTVTMTQFCECSGISSPCGGSCGAGVSPATYDSITAIYNISSKYNYNASLYPSTISKTIVVRVQ